MNQESSSSGIIKNDFFDAEDTLTSYSELACSGFNRIFKIKRSGKWFLLKGLKAEHRANPVYIELLKKEFALTSQLDHPNIVKALSKEHDSRIGPAILMEYIDGDNLEQLIKKNALSAELARKIAGQLMDALEYMHNKQMIHRDLKPSNIMITHNGQNVKLIDFGLSDSDSVCVLKSPAGTSGYIAPEQMLPGAKAEPRADIYSLGMVLGDMAKATGDKALSKMAEICSCRDPQSRPQNIVQLRQRLSCTPRYRHASLLLCALIIALLAALAGSYYHLEKNAQEPASSASDSIQPNDNKVIDYQLWGK